MKKHIRSPGAEHTNESKRDRCEVGQGFQVTSERTHCEPVKDNAYHERRSERLLHEGRDTEGAADRDPVKRATWRASCHIESHGDQRDQRRAPGIVPGDSLGGHRDSGDPDCGSHHPGQCLCVLAAPTEPFCEERRAGDENGKQTGARKASDSQIDGEDGE